MILHWLHQLPDLATLAITVLVVTGLTMSAPFLRCKLGVADEDKRSTAALDGFKAVMGMVGIVLAFSLVQANGALHSVETIVDKEAAAISATDRVLLRIGKPQFAQLRPQLVAYARTVIDDEWPGLNAGKRSARADAAFTIVSSGVRALAPDDSRQQTMYNELIRNLDDISDYREQILAATDDGLPSFFWITISGLLILGLALASLVDADLPKAVSVGASATAVALLLGFLIIVDLPFEGETSVHPTSIEKALVIMARRS